MDRGLLQATANGVIKSQTQLSDLAQHTGNQEKLPRGGSICLRKQGEKILQGGETA